MVFYPDRSTEVSWAERNYSDIRTIGDSDGSVAIVPVGSVEQHGHHLPVATDTILAASVSHRGAERVSDEVPVLVTPPEWVGSSPHHLSLGGTISGEYETLLHLLEQVVGCVLENGFDAAVLVNGHGGNTALVASVPRSIGPEYYPDAEVRACTYFDLLDSDTIAAIRESDSGGMAHAGEFETSLMLFLHPELVDRDSLKGTTGEDDMFDAGDAVAGYREIEDLSETGAVGDPRLASAAAGERFLEVAVEAVAELLLDVHNDVT